MSDKLDKKKIIDQLNAVANMTYEHGNIAASGLFVILRDAVEEGDYDAEQSQAEEAFRAALEFYADTATYDIDHLSKHGYIIIDRDGGKRAQAVLEAYPKEG